MAEDILSRGWVKGFSMWPNLIPGDILRAENFPAEDLEPGMIAVFPEHGETGDTVHRIVSLRNCSGFSVVVTAGDRSGIDTAKRYIQKGTQLKRITGVLRMGKYRRATSLHVPELLSPLPVVRLVSGIVRRFFW